MNILNTVALVVLCSVSLNAAVPVCVLGGPTAVNPKRQLAEGETFATTDRPLVVNLTFRPTKEHPEQVGECVLPSGSKVATKNGFLVWVAACGNDEVGRNIPVGPQPTPTPTSPVTVALSGIPNNITVNVDGSLAVHVDGEIKVVHSGDVAVNNRFTPKSEGEGGSFPWKKTFLWTGAIVGGVSATYWATHRPHHGPGARTGPAF